MAFAYNGSTAYTAFGSPSVFDSNAPYTVAFNFWYGTGGSEQKLMVLGGHGSYPYSYFNVTVITNNSLRWEAADPNIYTHFVSTTTNTYYHFAATWSGTGTNVFLNGTSFGTRSLTDAAWNNSLCTLGRNGTVSEYYLSGEVSNIGFWSTALTQAEITSLAKGFAPRRVRPQSLFDSSLLVRDAVSVKRAMTISNTSVTVAPHPRIY